MFENLFSGIIWLSFTSLPLVVRADTFSGAFEPSVDGPVVPFYAVVSS